MVRAGTMVCDKHLYIAAGVWEYPPLFDDFKSLMYFDTSASEVGVDSFIITAQYPYSGTAAIVIIATMYMYTTRCISHRY